MKRRMDESSDEQLVERAQGGRMDAFAELAQRYQQRIYHTIFGFTKNHLDADDLTQETFMAAFKSLDGFRGHSSFFTWIYRIAVNRTLNHLKKHRREKDREELTDNIQPAEERGPASRSPELNSLAGELRQKIEEAIEALPLLYRAPVQLVLFQGLSHGQAARVLRCSENTVSWRMFKARKMIQDRMRPYLKVEESHEMR
ncbi:MAG: sigma-70 family RNA polymerase sigma factor [Candidatus Aminicenantales bacterium]